MDSILNDVKKYLGLDHSYTVFDPELILLINSVFMILTQMGVGPEEGYHITGSTNVWSEFTEGDLLLEAVKVYIPLKVKLMWDTPQNSSVTTQLQQSIAELEWRLNVNAFEKNYKDSIES